VLTVITPMFSEYGAEAPNEPLVSLLTVATPRKGWISSKVGIRSA
jgi:hypothetical protein